MQPSDENFYIEIIVGVSLILFWMVIILVNLFFLSMGLANRLPEGSFAWNYFLCALLPGYIIARFILLSVKCGNNKKWKIWPLWTLIVALILNGAVLFSFDFLAIANST